MKQRYYAVNEHEHVFDLGLHDLAVEPNGLRTLIQGLPGSIVSSFSEITLQKLIDLRDEAIVYMVIDAHCLDELEDDMLDGQIELVDDSEGPWHVLFKGPRGKLRRLVHDHWPDEASPLYCDEMPEMFARRDKTLSAKELAERYPVGHPVHTGAQWAAEVNQGNTLRGYWDWVAAQLEEANHATD